MTSFLDRLTDAACVVVDWLVYLGVWCFWLGVLALALLGAVARGAPLPFPKIPPAARPPAVYLLHYHSAEFEVILHEGGRYEASNASSRWAGRWRTESGVLVVQEAVAGHEGDCLAGKAPWPIVWSPGPWGLGGERPAIWLERIR